MKPFIVIILCLAFIQKCDPYVVFDTPQPVNKGNQSSISEILTGTYINKDSTFLIITTDMILKKSEEYFEITEDELDTMSQYTYDENFIYGPILDTAPIIEKRYDTIMGSYIYKDTLFELSSNQFIRKYKGNYYLNIQQKDKTWEVIQFISKSDSLIIKSMDKEKDIDLVKNIAFVHEVIKDSSDKIQKYIITASQKEFKQFLKANGFQDIETWIKIE
jgi:hypothetical protein